MRYVNLQWLTHFRVYNRLCVCVCVCMCVCVSVCVYIYIYINIYILWSYKSNSPPLSKVDLNKLMHLREHAKQLNVYQTQLYIPRSVLQLMEIQIQEIGCDK